MVFFWTKSLSKSIFFREAGRPPSVTKKLSVGDSPCEDQHNADTPPREALHTQQVLSTSPNQQASH